MMVTNVDTITVQQLRPGDLFVLTEYGTPTIILIVSVRDRRVVWLEPTFKRFTFFDLTFISATSLFVRNVELKVRCNASSEFITHPSLCIEGAQDGKLVP